MSPHLANLSGATHTEYESHPRGIRLRGPNGTFSFESLDGLEELFVEFPVLPSFVGIREFRFIHQTSLISPPGPELSIELRSFLALETLAIECDAECDTDLSDALSPLMSDSTSHPSLKTLAFLNCVISDQFMQHLAQLASNRKDAALAGLHRVDIVHKDGRFPSIDSIRALQMCVPVVDVRFGRELPKDLT